MRISDWSSDVCSSDLPLQEVRPCAVCNAGTGNLRHRLRESAEHCCADPLVCCRLASSPATRRPRRLFCRGHARTPRQPLSPPAQLAAVRSAGRQVLRRAGAREHDPAAGHDRVPAARADGLAHGTFAALDDGRDARRAGPVALACAWPAGTRVAGAARAARSEEHTSELQSLMRISYAVFCLKKKTTSTYIN